MIIKQDQAEENSLSLFHYSSRLFLKLIRYGLLVIGFIVIYFVFIKQISVLTPQVTIQPTASFFDESVNLELKQQSLLGGTEIKYTLDGRTPVATSSTYHDPVTLDKTKVVKVALFRESQRISPVKTKEFFIKAEHDLPVVSLVTDSANLWDPDKGLYVPGRDEDHKNFNQTGSEWERPAVFRFFEGDDLSYQSKIGLRIHGGGTRSYPQKSFRIYADPESASGLIEYPFFPDNEVDQFETLVLRAAGGDWLFSYMRDVLAHRLVRKSGSKLDTQNDRPVVVYLNGQYWGLYYLRQRFDEEYFRQKYGVTPEKLSIFEVAHDVGENRGNVRLDEGDRKKGIKIYNHLLEEARACRHCAGFNYFRQYIDLQNLIDYYIHEIHFANFDWPYGNFKLWRYQNDFSQTGFSVDADLPYGFDGRYRCLFYDLDTGFGFGSETEEEMISAAQNGDFGYLIDDMFPFRNFFYDPTFAENFLNRYSNLLNTSLSSQSVRAEIEQLEAEIESEIPRQIARWKDMVTSYGDQTVQSVDEWRHNVRLLKVYADQRADSMRTNTKEDLGHALVGSGLEQLTFETNLPEAGAIKVHFTRLTGEDLPLAGLYFNNQSINIEAQPNFGYRFVRWDGDVPQGKYKQKKIRVFLERDMTFKAVFTKRF